MTFWGQPVHDQNGVPVLASDVVPGTTYEFSVGNESNNPGPIVCTSIFGTAELHEPVKRYVVGFAMERSSERVLLLRKLKPTWQRGLLNGVGGMVEEGEKPIDAMMREDREEIGEKLASGGYLGFWKEFAVLKGCGGGKHDVHCFSALVNKLPREDGFNDRGEEFVTVHLSEIGRRRDVIRNLKWLLPLAFDDPGAQHVVAEQFR